MKIAGIQKTTLIDYPCKVASTIFTIGCNLRCPYCHNKQLAFDFVETEPMSMDEVFDIIEERKNFIEGVSISGGEPTLQPDLIDFCREIKNRYGLAIKLDTNGCFPTVVNRVVEEGLVDYFAMDIKTSFARYKEHLGIDGENVYKSYKLIRDSGKDYELRMTCYPDFINTNTLNELMGFLSPNDRICIQKCNNEDDSSVIEYNDKQLVLFEDMFESKGFSQTLVRGIA